MQTDQWTAMSDIGKTYDGKIFMLDEYLRVENLYLYAILLIAQFNNVSSFEICSLETPEKSYIPDLDIVNHSVVNLESALAIAKKVLREEMWCKLQNSNMFVHFGYDYYMYIGSAEYPRLELDKIREMGLFVEEKNSPY